MRVREEILELLTADVHAEQRHRALEDQVGHHHRAEQLPEPLRRVVEAAGEVAGDEHELGAVFGVRPFSEPAFVGWGEVGFAERGTARGCFDHLLCFDEVDDGD